jgi:hypothetical protein
VKELIFLLYEMYDYNKLNLTDRANKLWGDGVFIVKVDNFALYLLYSFYCEVVLHNDEIVEIKAFKKGILLDKYLEVINVPQF